MKKYRQLSIIIIAFFALSGLYVYRNEYIRLRASFEDFNFMERLGPLTETNCLVINKSNHLDEAANKEKFSYPTSIWKQVAGFYVYSAYVINTGKLVSLGVGKLKYINLECRVWFEYSDIIVSNSAKFSYKIHRVHNSELSLIELFCEPTEIVKGNPYMMVLIENNGRKHLIPIYENKVPYTKNSSAICVYPDFLGTSKTSMIEFLSYHEVAGFTDIILYDIGLHYGIIRSMKNIVNIAESFKSFSTIIWNFPFYNEDTISKLLVEKDCLYRTHGSFGYVIFLNWNQYVFPKERTSLKGIFYMYGGKSNVRVNMDTQICCTEKSNIKNSDKSWPLVLRKAFCTSHFYEQISVFNPKIEMVKETMSLINHAVVSTYDNCHNLHNKTLKYFPVPMRFLSSLMGSKILRLWKSGTFFT